MQIEKGDKIFIVTTTLALDAALWDSYVVHANATLGNHFTKAQYIQKYTHNPRGYSYHTVLVDKALGIVVGGTSAIPVAYQYFEETLDFALSCDTFVVESYRKDFTLAYALFNNLTKHLKSVGIPFFLGIPDQFTLYPYLKKIVKWQEIGCLPTYALPINLPKIVKLDIGILNFLYRRCLTVALSVINGLSKVQYKVPRIYKKQDEGYNPNFLTEQTHKEVVFRYRILEDKHRIAQVVYFKNKDETVNPSALKQVLDYFIQHNAADVVVYIGTLPFKNHLMVTLPAKYRKREYYFMGKVIIPEKIDAAVIHDFNNWSFGFNNLDIR